MGIFATWIFFVTLQAGGIFIQVLLEAGGISGIAITAVVTIDLREEPY